jgi:hypothetical protein
MSLKKESELVIYYLDYIRNYKELTEEMLKNIENFDNNNKIKIIREYNLVLKVVTKLLE